MKIRSANLPLNQRGISHFLIPLALIMVLVVGVTFNAVAQQSGFDPSDLLGAIKGKKVKKVDSQMRLLLNPSADQKKVTGYIEVSSPGVDLSSKYCKATVRLNYVGPKTGSKKYRLKHTKPAGIANGYCVASVSRSLAQGDWTISANFAGNKYIKSTSGSISLSLHRPAKAARSPQPTTTTQPRARSALIVPTTFRIATYNVLGASHTDPGGDQATRPAYDTRLEKAVSVIRSSKLVVVGLQEFESRQRDKLLQLAGSDYDIYPSNASYDDDASDSSIIWQKSKFSLVDAGRTSIKYYNGRGVSTPWVKLKYLASGREFYVLNAHYPASNFGQFRNQQGLREEDARIQLADAEAKLASGTPVMILGDFNSSFAVRPIDDPNRANLVYCIFTSTGHFRHASDVRKGLSGQCPQQTGGGIDHIYVSDKVSVRTWGRIRNANTLAASDHSPAVAIVTVNQ